MSTYVNNLERKLISHGLWKPLATDIANSVQQNFNTTTEFNNWIAAGNTTNGTPSQPVPVWIGGQLYTHNGTTLILFSGGGSGPVTLTGDVTGTGTGTIAATLSSVVTPGSYNNVTVDAKGRVTAGSYAPSGASTVISITADRTLLSTDNNNILVNNGTGPYVLTVPDGLPSNFSCVILQEKLGGTLTLVAAGGSSVNFVGSTLATSGAGTSLSITWVEANWYVVATSAALGNSGITAGAWTKPTFNAQGIATSGTNLTASDIPALDLSNITTGKTTLARRSSMTGYIAETLSRQLATSSASAIASGRILFTQVFLAAGQTVTGITVLSSSTAGAGLTSTAFGLYDINLNRVALTPDDTSTSWAINTLKTLNLSTPYTVTTTGYYYVAVLVQGTTPPNIVSGLGLPSALSGITPIYCGLSATGQTSLTATSAISGGATTFSPWIGIVGTGG